VTTATRLHDAIAELAQLNDDPATGGITREVYTPTYRAALDRVAGSMREAALDVRLDAVGNLFGRWPGSEPDVDVRDSDLPARRQVVREIFDAAGEIAARRGVELAVTPMVEDAPVACEPLVIEAVEAAVRELDLPFRRMISGANHDAMVMGARVPVGMIFVPSAGGIGHHPDEHTDPADLELGVQVLAGTLARLAA